MQNCWFVNLRHDRVCDLVDGHFLQRSGATIVHRLYDDLFLVIVAQAVVIGSSNAESYLPSLPVD